MAGTVMVLGNPRKRKRKAKKRRHKKRKMTAKQLKFFGPRRTRKAPKRKPAKRRRRKSKPKQEAAHMAKRKRRHSRKRVHKNPRRRHRRVHRNPRLLGLGTKGFITNAIVPAAIGAAGAVGNDWVFANFIPAAWKTGQMATLARAASAFAVGMAVSAITGNEEYGEQATSGALIVQGWQMMRSWAQTSMPNVRLARYMPMNRYLGRRRRPMGFIRRRQLGATSPPTRFRPMRAGQGALGYIGPARTLNGMGRYMSNGRTGG